MLSREFRDSVFGTVTVAATLCLVCSLVVSTTAVMLKPMQLENAKVSRQKNILEAAGEKLSDPEKIKSRYVELVDTRVIDLDTGLVTKDSAAMIEAAWDQKKASQSEDPKDSLPIPGTDDIASVKRRENQSYVYFIWSDQGELEKVIVPIRGYGLWSTLYGFLAINADGETVEGITFYEQKETPGLGGEVESQSFKSRFLIDQNKKLYNDEGDVAFQVLKGAVDPKSPNAKHQIDGLAGATITSQGVENMIRYWLGKNGFQPFLDNVKAGKFSAPDKKPAVAEETPKDEVKEEKTDK